MKKLLVGLAVISLGATAAHAAGMDCCKDGKCECCKDMDKGQPAPTPKS